jgi:hypothetical protein
MKRIIIITAFVAGLPMIGQTLGTLTAHADDLAEVQDADSQDRDYVPPDDCDNDDSRGC